MQRRVHKTQILTRSMFFGEHRLETGTDLMTNDWRVDLVGMLSARRMTNLCEGSRKGLTEGLRKFTQVDNRRALECWTLERRFWEPFFRTRRPKGSKRHPDVTVRESPDELTFRAEEAVRGSHTPMSITKQRRGADWCAFCQALYKGIEGEDW